MPAACFLENVMQPDRMELDASGNVTQEFIENTLLSKLVCFFCDKEFPGVQVLHSHQNECALASNSQKILTDTKNSVGKKRTFLSCLNLIPKVNADHVRSEKRKDVVLDVIVIEDDSDDENKDISEDKSQRYLLSPNSVDSKTKQNGRLRSKNKSNSQTQCGVFTKPSSKVFKFDISSPLGMRLRYYGKESGDCRLPISKVITTNYEQYCGTSATRNAHSNKCYHVTYRKSRQPSKFCHQYNFTRAQLRESCKARCSGLSLSSLQLKQQMKPCKISLEKLNLSCDNSARGTCDAKKLTQLLNLKSADENFTKVLDKDVAVTEMQNVMDKSETFIVSRSGLLNIFSGVQGLELHQSNSEKTINVLKHPVKKIGIYQSYSLRNPDASSSTVNVYLPVVDSCPRLFEPVNKHIEHTQAFVRNVEFVPLTALAQQNVFEVENHDPQTRMFQISSVYSLAKSQSNMKSVSNDLAKEQHSPEKYFRLIENCQKIASSASSADVITIVDHDSAPLEAAEKSSEITDRQSALLTSATDVIDLTENVSSSPPDNSETSASISQQTVVESSSHKTSGVLRDISQQVGEKLCCRSFDKSQNSADVPKLPTEKTSVQQTSHLQKELERPIVIEIPDEDSAICTEQQRNYAAQLHDNNKNLVNSDRITTSPSQRVPDKNRHSVPPTWHSVQPTVPPGGRNAILSSDTIDLSFDSDSEALDKEPVALGKKRPLSSNFDSCPPRKRDRPGVSLEHSSLPPLTFRCHICSSLFNFDNNSGTMIRNHYLMHNVTNIELVKQVLPSGQTTWSLVELNNVLQSTHSKPPGSATSTSVARANVSPNCVGIEASVTRPSVTLHYNPPVVSSSRSVVRESTALPEFVSSEQSRIPETLSSIPDVSCAKKRFSPNATRLNSEGNCSTLPVGRTRSMPASSVADVNTSKSTSSNTKDTVLSQTGGQGRNDVAFRNQTIDVNTLRAIHLARLRPNVPISTHAFAGSLPEATATSTEQRKRVYIPTSANFNRMLVERGRGDSSAGNQTKSKHNASVQSNNNVVHGVICLD